MLRLWNSVLRKYVGRSSPCSPRNPLAVRRAACTVCTASSQKKKIGKRSRPQSRVPRKTASVSPKKTRFCRGVGPSRVSLSARASMYRQTPGAYRSFRVRMWMWPSTLSRSKISILSDSIGCEPVSKSSASSGSAPVFRNSLV